MIVYTDPDLCRSLCTLEGVRDDLGYAYICRLPGLFWLCRCSSSPPLVVPHASMLTDHLNSPELSFRLGPQNFGSQSSKMYSAQ